MVNEKELQITIRGNCKDELRTVAFEIHDRLGRLGYRVNMNVFNVLTINQMDSELPPIYIETELKRPKEHKF